MQKGDKLVCILNIRGAYMGNPRLFLNQIYTLKSVVTYGFKNEFTNYYIEEHSQYSYPSKSFMLLTEYRRLKIEKIKIKIENENILHLQKDI